MDDAERRRFERDIEDLQLRFRRVELEGTQITNERHGVLRRDLDELEEAVRAGFAAMREQRTKDLEEAVKERNANRRVVVGALLGTALSVVSAIIIAAVSLIVNRGGP